jgi:ankyrin repeat protein
MTLNLPDRANYEFLKKRAKERLAVLRTTSPETQLATAQLAIAREYGFASWRALKAEIDRRRAPRVAEFSRACRDGDVPALQEILAADPGLARERVNSGSTGLHLAARHPKAVRLLLEHGADPNARDVGDNASPLHCAAANRSTDSVRALLDAGADVHGRGDLHDGNVIGWAAHKDNREVVDLLLARGARHHIFSAMAMGDRAVVERLVEENPDELLRRRSRFENGHTPVHAAFAPPDGLGFLTGEPDYAMLTLLVELGADVDRPDDRGRSPLDVALLRGDREATRILTAAGATTHAHVERSSRGQPFANLAESVKGSDPMFRVKNVRETVRWYRALGFRLVEEYEDGHEVTYARLAFGKCEFGLSTGASTGPRDVSLWIYTDRVEELYERLKAYQRAAVDQKTSGDEDLVEVRFDEDLYSPFYGGRQFSVRDPDGLSVIFYYPDWPARSEKTEDSGS